MSMLHIEGNNGGDFIDIEKRGEDKVYIKIAHCCVVYFEGVVPNEMITSTLANAMGNLPVEEWKLPWDDKYNKHLLEKVEEIR